GFMPVTNSSLDAELGKRRSGRRREVDTWTFLQRPPACAFRAYKHGGVFEPVWTCLGQLPALSIEYLERGDLAFNQGVPGSIPGRLTKSFGYFRHRLVAQPGTMVAYRWRAVATRPRWVCHGLEGLPLTGAAAAGRPAHRVHQ